jgi:3-oxoadipate enol-lactonase
VTEPVLLLVHGFPLDGRMWSAQVNALFDKRKVAAPDLDGHGTAASATPSDTVDGMARQLARRLDDLGADQADLGGFSMGGYVVFAFLRLFPDRVRSLALIDTRATADTDAGREGRDAMAAKIREEGSRVAAEAMLPKMFTDSAPAELRAESERIMLEQPPETLVADLMAMRDRPDSTDLLPAIKVPTLIVVGSEDPITPPSEAEAMAAAIPGARLVRVDAAAHLSPVERANDVNTALRQHLDR